MKTFLTLTIITFSVYSQTSFSQSRYEKVINFLSLENKEVSVKYSYDPKYDRLIFELNPHEKFCIQDARGVVSGAKILQKKFVELQLEMKGGSGEAVRKYVIICVSKGKIYKSIEMVSLVKDLITGSSSCQINFSELIEKDKSFELIANGETTLHFDFDNKIFFDGYEYLNGLYYVNSDKDPVKRKMIFQNEKYPTLFNQYIFIKNKWYVKCLDNQLMEFTSDCN